MDYKTIYPNLLIEEIKEEKIIETDPNPNDILKGTVIYSPINKNSISTPQEFKFIDREVKEEDIIYFKLRNSTEITLDKKYLIVSVDDILICQNKY